MSQSLDRGLELLQLLSSEPKTLEELANPLDVHKSTVLRLLRTMENRGFVNRLPNNRYTLGYKFYLLSARAMSRYQIVDISRPHMTRLNYRTSQATHLSVFEAGRTIYVDKLEAKHGMRLGSMIGLSVPLHASAAAKVLLAGLPDNVLDVILQNICYTPFTPKTITNAEAYLTELAQVRTSGFAVEQGEHEIFVNGIAAPIHDASGRVIAAVSLLIPAPVLPYADVLELVPEVISTAADITSEYRGKS